MRTAAASKPLGVPDPRALDGDPQPAGRICGRIDGSLHLLLAHDIGMHEPRRLPKLCRKRLTPICVEISDHDERAARMQSPSRSLAKPGGAAHNQRACAFDPHGATLDTARDRSAA